jgi:hypothetical protein
VYSDGRGAAAQAVPKNGIGWAVVNHDHGTAACGGRGGRATCAPSKRIIEAFGYRFCEYYLLEETPLPVVVAEIAGRGLVAGSDRVGRER